MTTITQETFDETVLENQDLFDLKPNDAITETLSQFTQQGLKNLKSYILTSHPESILGKQERSTRKDFQTYVTTLDSAVQLNGQIIVEDIGVSVILDALNGISDFCNGTYVEQTVHVEDEVVEEQSNEEQEEDKENTKKQKTKSEKSLAFLTLLNSSESLFTLMSLLSVITLPSVEEPTPQPPTHDQLQILNQVTQLLTSVFTPKSMVERTIKCNLKDKFLCMERLVGLLSHFTNLVKEQTNLDDEATEEDKDDTTASSLYSTALEHLLSLGTAACRNSERNKVAFVRVLKNSPTMKINSQESTIRLLIQILYLVHAKLEVYKEDEEEYTSCIAILTSACRFLAVLCRFDDFRDSSAAAGAGGGLGVDSSYGQNVSSAHDHVLEFHREGVVPVLHAVIVTSLQGHDGPTMGNGDEQARKVQETWVELASVALAATRVLAVNDDIVQSWVAVGILKVIQLALNMGIPDEELDGDEHTKEDHVGKSKAKQYDRIQRSRQSLTSGAIGLIRNLCGNDEIKTTLCIGSYSDPSQSVLRSILKGMQLYLSNASIQEHGCGAIAAMALRKPTNSMHIIQEGGANDILTAMKQCSNNVLVQRQGALAIRNIVSRLVANTNGNGTSSDQEASVSAAAVRDTFLDLGAEVILRNITGRHQGSVDEAYAALRDLGCPVSMSKIDSETGKVTTRTEMFGDKKPNFRPVYGKDSK